MCVYSSNWKIWHWLNVKIINRPKNSGRTEVMMRVNICIESWSHGYIKQHFVRFVYKEIFPWQVIVVLWIILVIIFTREVLLQRIFKAVVPNLRARWSVSHMSHFIWTVVIFSSNWSITITMHPYKCITLSKCFSL